MGQVKNQYYKDFLDGFLLNEITRQDINTVIEGIQHQHRSQARVLVILAWASGRRPNEYLRLTPENFSKSKEYLEIKMPGSKGSESATVSMPRYLKDGETLDPLTLEVHDYVYLLFPAQKLFWFFVSDAVRYGVLKKYKRKDGTTIVRRYDKIYDKLSNKLPYYFKKWFEPLFPDGIPPYYLRHNRATKLLDTVGREGTMMNMGWKAEATLKRYTHKTKKMRKEIAKGLME